MSDYTHGKTDITAEQAGFNSRYLELMENHYADLVKSGRVHGAGFLMARRGKIFAHQTIGRMTYEKDSGPLKPEHIKGWASITKVLTATAVMRCLEEGKLWLDQPVAEIIKEFDTDLHKTITVRHLLTHTSGLMADPGYFCEPNPEPLFEYLYKTDLIKKLTTGPLQSKPGKVWSYCSMGFHVLAEIVSRVSGKHFYDYMREEVFLPLGMKDTMFEIPEGREKDLVQIGDWTLEMVRNYKLRNAGPLPYGGGGAFGTMIDLFKFAQAYCNGGQYNGFRLLGKNTVGTMTRDQLKGVSTFHWGAVSDDYSYGLGWGVSADGDTCPEGCFNHEGFGWSSMFIDPVDEFVYISMVVDQSEWDPHIMVKPRVMAFAGVE